MNPSDICFLHFTKDAASTNIANHLHEQGVKAVEIDDVELIFDVDKSKHFPSANPVVVLSRHVSSAGVPSLTVHVPGNWNDAQYGGQPKTLSTAMPCFMASCLKHIKKNVDLRGLSEIQVCYEVDHHGPTTTTPIAFVEIGSDERAWKDPLYGEIIASALVETIDDFQQMPAYVGVGGGHYAPTFTKYTVENDVAFGHMLPKYQGVVDAAVFAQAVEKNVDGIEAVVIEKKWISSAQKTFVKQWCSEHGVECHVVDNTWF